MKILLEGKLIRHRVMRVLGLLLVAYIIALLADRYSRPSPMDVGDVISVLAIPMIMLGLFWLFREMGNVMPGITLDDTTLELPFFYFWTSRIPLSSIVTTGGLNINVGAPLFSIGLSNGSNKLVDSSVFSSLEEFEMLRTRLAEVAAQNRQKNAWSVLEAKDLSAGIHGLQLVFVVLWSYLFYLVHLVDAGKTIAILELGALTETVWSPREFYRFSSWFFLHSGIFHLLINVMTFATLSTSLLRIIDSSRYLCVLLLSTLFAALYVVTVTPEHYVIGASAGIFGLFGAHCALKFNKYLPVHISAYSNKTIVILIVLEFIMEPFATGISSAAHLGGGVAGYALMRTVLYFNPSNRIYESTRLEKGLAVVLVLAALAGLLRFLSLAAHI